MLYFWCQVSYLSGWWVAVLSFAFMSLDRENPRSSNKTSWKCKRGVKEMCTLAPTHIKDMHTHAHTHTQLQLVCASRWDLIVSKCHSTVDMMFVHAHTLWVLCLPSFNSGNVWDIEVLKKDCLVSFSCSFRQEVLHSTNSWGRISVTFPFNLVSVTRVCFTVALRKVGECLQTSRHFLCNLLATTAIC